MAQAWRVRLGRRVLLNVASGALSLVCLTRVSAAQERVPPESVSVQAQRAAAPPAVNVPSRVVGRVVRPAEDTTHTVPNIWVTLHRVGHDTAGPVDSVRTGANGEYSIPYRRFGDPDAVYFTAAIYNGIAYFSAPLAEGTTSRDDGEITVFDTTSREVPITVRGHHLIIGSPNAAGERTVTEVFELSNDTTMTRVAVGDAASGASWSWMLVPQSMHPAVVQGDFPAEAVKFIDGRVLVYSPMAPGLKQLAYSYSLPGSAFPLSVPALQATSIFEVLVEEPTADVKGTRMKQVASVNVDGRQFRRFVGSDVPASGVVNVSVPVVQRPLQPWYFMVLTVLIGGVMVGTLVWAMRRR